MQRCIDLALQGAGHVAPNPMVGAVLVHNGRIIGEGYHQQYGKAHAEVNCINSVHEADRPLIKESTIYVSLEPCAHFGKTPPCADRIIDEQIPNVVVGIRDPFTEVDGKGIEKLRAAGINVTIGVLEQECRRLNRHFFTFHTEHRPYIMLKWAQTANGKIASTGTDRLLISNEYSNRLVHKWRSEQMGILVGTNTALMDDPSLSNRLWTGNNPIRLVIDMDLQIPSSARLYNEEAPTIVFNKHRHSLEFKKDMIGDLPPVSYYQVTENVDVITQLLHACYQMQMQSILVEGGARLLQHFIISGNWDEAYVITNETLTVADGLSAPALTDALLEHSSHLQTDRIDYFIHSKPEHSGL